MSGHEVNADLDTLIERRSGAASKQQELEDLWAASEKRDRERRRRKNRALWYEFHMRLSEAHARIAKEHEAKGLALLEEPDGKSSIRSRIL